MQRIEHVELIEAVIAQLSPEGREAWEELEQVAELGLLDKDRRAQLSSRTWKAQAPKDRTLISALCSLSVGLAAENLSGLSLQEVRAFREVCVVKAAQVRERAEGRFDPGMLLEEAIARLVRSQEL